MVVISETSSMFWGVTVDTGKRYSQTVDNSFHLSMAALEPGSGNEYVQVMVQHGSSEFLLCSLHQGKLMQQSLDLIFGAGEEVSFSLVGKGVVHLTGYLLPDQPLDDFSDMDSDEESDAPQLVEMDADELQGGKKRKAIESASPSKKMKLLESFDEDDYDSDEDEDYDDVEEEDDDDSEDEDDEEFSEDDLSFDEDEDSEEDDEVDEQTPVKQKKEPVTPKGDKAGSAKKKSPKPETPKSNKKESNQTPLKSPQTPSTPANGESSKKKKKKKKSKGEGTPSPSDKSSAESTPKSAIKGKDSTPAKGDTPKSAKKGKDNTPSKIETPGKKKVVSGGTVVEDMKVGHGPEAKAGKMVSVYYTGILSKSSKQFDSCTSGKPFRFRLKQGEVIKGWDNGVEGMKVGGKRKITVPANQGYGGQRQGPIPPNSSLTFEVELKAVS